MGLNAVYYDLENWKGILASYPKKGQIKVDEGTVFCESADFSISPDDFLPTLPFRPI